MDVSAIITRAMRIKGKTSYKELQMLHALAETAPDGPAVEVGALHGRSMLVWSKARRGHGEMVVIDDECRDTLRANLPADVQCWQGLSWEMVWKLPGLAFCFIDADHGIDAFPKDLIPYAAKVMPGGILAMHDYDPERQEFAVQRYVDAWQNVAKWQYLGRVESLIAFRRPV